MHKTVNEKRIREIESEMHVAGGEGVNNHTVFVDREQVGGLDPKTFLKDDRQKIEVDEKILRKWEKQKVKKQRELESRKERAEKLKKAELELQLHKNLSCISQLHKHFRVFRIEVALSAKEQGTSDKAITYLLRLINYMRWTNSERVKQVEVLIYINNIVPLGVKSALALSSEAPKRLKLKKV
ncbi:hypothetical protein ROZALSC1DRAFT_25748 [Rozella allomycis CSF55]|uniref:Uncharacterized protein n=1 Tax=Rozella allomycis (strain CSF55) TaxID=988480 RepID=A0A4P9YCX8_ROZAC|nr:hypothetical protein ROZALSC1DRAFT_25748 [Rozella allomycis CSF55]